MASPHISLLGWGHLWRVSSAPNELLPSNFSLPRRLASIHLWHACNGLSELLSCWSRRPCKQMNSSYSDVRRAAEALSLRCAFVDDWLGSLMAGNHQSPSRLASKSSLCLCKSLLGSYERTCVLVGTKVIFAILMWLQWWQRFVLLWSPAAWLILPTFPPFHLHRLAPAFYRKLAECRTRRCKHGE